MSDYFLTNPVEQWEIDYDDFWDKQEREYNERVREESEELGENRDSR